MTYELIDITCLHDTARRFVVGRELDAVADPLRVLRAKMRQCADDFRRLGKEWRRLDRPRGKQARRAAFAAHQRARRAAR